MTARLAHCPTCHTNVWTLPNEDRLASHDSRLTDICKGSRRPTTGWRTVATDNGPVLHPEES